MSIGFCHGRVVKPCLEKPDYAKCNVASDCDNLCRSGLFFPPYYFLRSYCEERTVRGSTGNYCICVWQCNRPSNQAPSPVSAPISF